jgi:long-chain acyl-CoA synthetase
VVGLTAVLLTGATGFLGTQIARYLVEREETEVWVLVRALTSEEAKRRLLRNWWDWPELIASMDAKVKVICGDVCQPQLGVSPEVYQSLTEHITHIIHAAADWRLVSLEELRKTNVAGTAHVLELARAINKRQGLERFAHVSTAYVAGARTGAIPEEALTDEYGFFTAYEQSKYEGEKLVQQARDEFAVSVFRPPMIVGDSRTGAIKTFNTVYFPLRLYLTGKMRIMPVKRNQKINLAPVDYVAKTIAQLTFNAQAAGKTFHVVAPYDSLPTIGEMLDYVQTWAKANLGVNLPKPLYVNISAGNMKRLLGVQRALQPRNRRFSDALASLAPYFSEKHQFQRQNVDQLLGLYKFQWQAVLPHLLEYATYCNFFHRSERTVYEQVMFRLESKSNPVSYFDVIEGKIVPKSAEQVRSDILGVAGALRALGIGAGDRVALTGLNSTKYLAVDIAIGIIGAVSVPLYYTSPPSEIDQVLDASGAKLLFVGIPGLLRRVDELKAEVLVVSFCREPVPVNMKRVVSWEAFLAKAPSSPVPEVAPVGFGGLATLRYSSGTTGKPKGAIFHQDNLRYMAESTASITPWRARNQRSSYLSFLPMGHVVEGILAAYSPYYIAAPIEIYFLEDFRKLQSALPQVRPNIFFAVPRIYEKVWEGIEKNRLGRTYVHMKKGPLKRLLGRIVRNATLKRAGLNRCHQLIAGSASSDERLLQNFRELGVEIYDAYGLTEAPLVTLNRLGRNRLETVGEPMPFTEVQISAEGEIMVKGPQVMKGYFDKTVEPPFKDGWLMTGDIGKLTSEGSLIIFGRKKELIKTSYGKCIYCSKIEGMLREIAGVSEALLVGECKPYCAAVLWVQKEQWNPETAKRIDAAIEELNKRVSNPEKVKRWALLENTLTVEAGDLTPNLKLKRNIVTERFAQVIEALYGGNLPQGDIHVGGVEKPE